MRPPLQIMNRAFAVLESLPQGVAFEIFAKLDLLTEFPEIGSPLGLRFPDLKGFRQLIFKRRIRIIYDFDQSDRIIYVLAIIDCKRKMPRGRDLKRDLSPGDELPLE